MRSGRVRGEREDVANLRVVIGELGLGRFLLLSPELDISVGAGMGQCDVTLTAMDAWCDEEIRAAMTPSGGCSGGGKCRRELRRAF